MEKIDTLDKKILEIIMNNARIPSKDVAQVCGVSRAAVHQRIQRLIDDGVITGSGYNVNRLDARAWLHVPNCCPRAPENQGSSGVPLHHWTLYDDDQGLCP